MADPSKIAEPRVLALLLSLPLALGVAMTLITPSPQYAGDPPVVLTTEGAPRQAEADAAMRACQRAGAYGDCMVWLLARTREKATMHELRGRRLSSLPRAHAASRPLDDRLAR